VTAVNSLVVGRVEMSTPLAGTFLLEDCDMISSGIKSGDWVEGGMGAFAAVADGVAMVLDPLGSAIGMGIGWLIEHMEPIKGWFNDLTGDAGEVMGFAGTWESIAAQMQSASDELTRVLGDLDSQHGLMVETYRKFQTECAAHAAAAGRLSSAIGTGMQIASTIVQAVHDITRDALSQAIGELMPLLDDAARLFRSLKSAFDDVLTGASDAVRSATRKADDVLPASNRFGPNDSRGVPLDARDRVHTTLTDVELETYLKRNADVDEVALYTATGRWPESLPIPEHGTSLYVDGSIDWSSVPHDGFEIQNGLPLHSSYVPQQGEVFDRYGSGDGRVTSSGRRNPLFVRSEVTSVV